MLSSEDDTLDLAGIGIGPFNLSLAALLQRVPAIRSRFFERRPTFLWHEGLLFPDSTIQVSFLKDLVTLVDPTSAWSFLAFLCAKKRMYRFLNAGFRRVTRREFNQYFRWVAEGLDNLEFGSEVEAVEYEGGETLTVHRAGGSVSARNLVLGTGLAPKIPSCAQPHLGRTVFHVSAYLTRSAESAGRRVVVVGGGQSGAEVVYHLLTSPGKQPARLFWVTRRSGFLPLDETPFTNELFTPAYSDHFYRLPAEEKGRRLNDQILASDGIDPALLDAIYRRLYDLEFLEGQERCCCLHPGAELTGLSPAADGGWSLGIRSLYGGGEKALEADLVLLATGAEYRRPACLDGLRDRISWSQDGYAVGRDFSIEWDGPPSIRIYVQNAARRNRGIADPNLSLMAWRSAVIINSLAGERVYDVEEASSVFDWSDGEDEAGAAADWHQWVAAGGRS